MSVILGINTFHAGSSAALVINGEPIVALAEERLNRVKYYAGFPKLSILKCLDRRRQHQGVVDGHAHRVRQGKNGCRWAS